MILYHSFILYHSSFILKDRIYRSVERSHIYLGKSDSTGSPCFYGFLDDVKLFSRALSNQEILDEFNGN